MHMRSEVETDGSAILHPAAEDSDDVVVTTTKEQLRYCPSGFESSGVKE